MGGPTNRPKHRPSEVASYRPTTTLLLAAPHCSHTVAAGFKDSPLTGGWSPERARDDARRRLRMAQAITPGVTDKRLPSLHSLVISDHLSTPECREHVAVLIAHIKSNGPIVVNCSCIEVAAVCVVKSMCLRYGLDIQIDYADRTSHDQIQKIETHSQDYFDFVIAANAPIFLRPEALNNYVGLFECHCERQFVFRKKGKTYGRSSLVFVHRESAAEEQYRAKVGIPEGVSAEAVDRLEDVRFAADHLEAGEMLITWNPVAHALRRNTSLEVLCDSEYRVWASLFCHRRWREPSLLSACNAFSLLFQNEWKQCASNLSYSLAILSTDSPFMSALARGATVDI